MKWRLEIYDTLTSTSDYCRTRIENGEEEGLAILAHCQTKARGSRGREWLDNKGNLALSFIVTLPDIQESLRTLPFIVGLAVHHVSHFYLSQNSEKKYQLHLKWPNDLLLNHKKMAGILIETLEYQDKRKAIIGVGVNLASAPQIEGRALAALSDMIMPPNNIEYAQLLLAAFNDWRHYEKLYGEAALYQEWLKKAHPVGTSLAVKGSGEYMRGSFVGVDGYGNLLLRDEHNIIHSFITGEIFCV